MFDDAASDDDGVNVIIDFTQRVNLVRVLGNSITPARLTIKAEVLPSPDAKDVDFDIAFAKIKFWFETVVARTVVFGRDNALALAMLTDVDGRAVVANCLMIAPNEPTDEHLAVLFQSKMQALSGGTMGFGIVRVNSESSTGLVWSYVGSWDSDLPSMEQWFNKTPYYFTSPWWARNDTSTIDMISKGATDFSQPPAWAYTLDFIEAAIRPRSEPAPKPAGEALESVVIRGAFRPKVIEGGADEE